MQTSLPDIFERFLAADDVKESSRRTYRKALAVFSQWLDDCGLDVDRLKPADIVEFKESLTDRSPLTVNLYLSAVRGFYRWAERCGLCGNVAASVGGRKVRKRFVKMHLEDDECRRLVEAASRPKAVKGANALVTRQLADNARDISLRDSAMITLMLKTGLRTIEVARADVGDIVIRRGRRLLKVWGKGRTSKDDFVIITDQTYGPLKRYLDTRPYADPGEPLFCSGGLGREGRRLSTRTIQDICKRHLKEIGLDGHEYSAHSLRHTTGTAILRRGGSMYDVQKVLRHASSTTSQIYVETIRDEERIDRAGEDLLDD